MLKSSKVKKKLIIVLNSSSWDFLCDYISQMALALGKKERVIVFNPFYFPTLKNLIFDWRKRQEWLSGLKIKGIVFFPSFGYFPFQRFSIVKTMNTYLNFKLLWVFLFFKYPGLKPFFWTFSLETAGLINFLKQGILIYDRPDHLASVDPKKDWEIKKKEEIVIKAAKIVFVNSPLSLDYVRKFNETSFLTPWGCGEDFFKKEKIKVPVEVEKISRPRIGFVGHLNHRVNMKLLYRLAFASESWSFILVGPVFDYDPQQSQKINFYFWLEELKKLPNVYLIGSKPKREMKNYISFFDVCLIPYDIKQEFVKGCNPMKFYEYLALGKPVVSVPIAALSSFPKKAIISANSVRKLKEGIAFFLKSGISRKMVFARKKIARENTWERRVIYVLGVIDEEIY